MEVALYGEIGCIARLTPILSPSLPVSNPPATMASEGNCEAWAVLLRLVQFAFLVAVEHYPTEAKLMLESVPPGARLIENCPWTNISTSESAAVGPHCDTDNIEGGFQIVVVMGDHDQNTGGQVYVPGCSMCKYSAIRSFNRSCTLRDPSTHVRNVRSIILV